LGGDHPTPPMGTTPEALCAKNRAERAKVLCNFTRNDYHIEHSRSDGTIELQRLKMVEIVTLILWCNNYCSVLKDIWADVTGFHVFDISPRQTMHMLNNAKTRSDNLKLSG
jgi:hypothetical protein